MLEPLRVNMIVAAKFATAFCTYKLKILAKGTKLINLIIII